MDIWKTSLCRYSLNGSESRMRWKYSFIGTVLFCMAAHGFVYFNLSPRHDMLQYVDQFAGLWEIRLGRFFQVSYSALMRGDYQMPWLSGMLSMLYLGIACFLISELLYIKDRWIVLLSAGFMTANATMVDLHYSFLYAADAFALALLCACAGAFCVIRRSDLTGAVLAAVFFTVALGLYQSYILIAGILLILEVMQQALRGRLTWKRIKPWMWYAAAVLLTAILYFSLYKGLLAYYHTEVPSEENSGVIYNSPAFLDTFTFPLFRSFTKKAYISFFGYFFGLGQRQFTFCHVINILLVIGTIAAVLVQSRRRRLGVVNLALLAGGCAVFPGVAQFMTILTRSNTTYFLTAHGLFLMYPAMLTVISRWVFPRKRGVRTAVLVLCGCLLFSGVRFSNEMYTFQKVQFDKTLSHMTRIMNSINSTPEYLNGETEVILVGDLSASVNSIRKPDGYEWLAGPSEAGVNSPETFAAFADLLGEYAAITTDDAVLKEYAALDQVKNMPAYPSRDFCRMIDGKLVVKLSR